MKPFSILVLLICTPLAVFAQDVPRPVPPTPKPFRILAQSDAPLRIISADTKLVAPDNKLIEVFVVVENVSPQIVTNYVTLRGLEGDPYVDACLGPPGSFGQGLKPGEQIGTSSWQPASTLDSDLAVWVDFVELADGTRWGRNDCHTGEFLDGKRAGFRSQKEQLLRVLREQGFEPLMQFIKDNFQSESYRKIVEAGGKPVLPIAPPGGHSKRWEEGFLAGAKAVLQDVIKAERDYGANEVEHVLLRPT